MADIDFEAKRVVTPEARIGYPHVFTAHKMDEKSEAKYSMEMYFPKSADITPLKTAALNAAAEKYGPDKAKWPKGLKFPFKDGDNLLASGKVNEGYEGAIVVRASAKKQPGLVNGKREPILDENQFYAGCYGRAELVAYTYDVTGNKGVGFALLNVQKTKDGEKFSGRKDAKDVFDEVKSTSDDPLNYGAGNDSSFDLGM